MKKGGKEKRIEGRSEARKYEGRKEGRYEKRIEGRSEARKYDGGKEWLFFIGYIFTPSVQLLTFPSLYFPGSAAVGQFSNCNILPVCAERCPAVCIALDEDMI